MKLKLDLHDIYNRGGDIDRALRAMIDEAVAKKVQLVEIIPGKGSGQLKKRVLRFLDQKEIKALYDRVEKDSHNFGRVFVHFRPKVVISLEEVSPTQRVPSRLVRRGDPTAGRRSPSRGAPRAWSSRSRRCRQDAGG